MLPLYILAYQRAFDFKGRSSRMEYWVFFVGNILIEILLIYLEPFLADFGILSGEAVWVYSAIALIPGISLAVRRVHDRNLAWYYGLIPCYNMILMFLPGDEGANDYGPNYGPNPSAVTGSGSKKTSYQQQYCENCGVKLPLAVKKDRKGMVIIGGIAVLSVIVNIQLYNHAADLNVEVYDLEDENYELQEDIYELQEDIYKLQDNNYKLQENMSAMEEKVQEYAGKVLQAREEIDFYENNIALIPHWNGERLYHKYWCETFQDNIWFYFAKDIEYVEEEGILSPCPECYLSD